MRVLFDTNVFISFFLKPRSPPAQAVLSGFLRHDVVSSRHLLDELGAKLMHPKFAAYAAPDQVAEFVSLLESGSTLVSPIERITACRDPDDNHVLEVALAGQVAVIVTGDSDLLALHPFRGVTIIKPATFLTIE